MSYSLEDREDQKHSCYTAGELLERYSEDGKMSYSSLCTPLRKHTGSTHLECNQNTQASRNQKFRLRLYFIFLFVCEKHRVGASWIIGSRAVVGLF